MGAKEREIEGLIDDMHLQTRFVHVSFSSLNGIRAIDVQVLDHLVGVVTKGLPSSVDTVRDYCAWTGYDSMYTFNATGILLQTAPGNQTGGGVSLVALLLEVASVGSLVFYFVPGP